MSETVPVRAHRRSAKACNLCRARKVRCDVVTHGPPCTNCRLDRVECTIPASGPRHQRRQQAKSARPSTPTATDGVNDSRPEFDILGNSQPAEMRRSSEVGSAVAAGSSVDNAFGHTYPQSPDRSQVAVPPTSKADSRSDGQASTFPLNSSVPKQTSNMQSNSSGSPPIPDIYLPVFIQPMPSHLQVEDVEFLHRKGVFAVPEASLRKHLLICYLRSVHPFMPILDLEQLAAVADQQNRYPPMSLLLFQAVMFAATSYIDMRYLAMHGYTNRRAVRRTFFTRVKLLSDLDYETDRIAILQATMLMTYWHEDPESAKNAYFWLGDAVSHLRDLGFDRTGPNDVALTKSERSRRKRLWWSCYVRDRLCSTALRSNTRISDDSFRVPKLELSDFEIEFVPEGLSRISAENPSGLSSSTREKSAELFLVLIDLCIHVGEILNAQNGLGRSRAQNLDPTSNATSDAGRDLLPPADIVRYDCILQQWHSQYAALLGFCGTTPIERPPDDDYKLLDIHRAVIKGLFLITVSILHRQQLLSSSPILLENQELIEYSRRKAFGAANDITTLFSHLEAAELLRSVPNTGVTCLVTAAVSHLLEQKSGISKQADQVPVKLRFCVHALNILAECYGSAEFASKFIEAAMIKTQPTPQIESMVNGTAGVGNVGLPRVLRQPRATSGHQINSESSPMSNQVALTNNGQTALGYPGSDLSSIPGSDVQLTETNVFSPAYRSYNYPVSINGEGEIYYPVANFQSFPSNMEIFDMASRAKFFTNADGLGVDFDSSLVDMLASNV